MLLKISQICYDINFVKLTEHHLARLSHADWLEILLLVHIDLSISLTMRFEGITQNNMQSVSMQRTYKGIVSPEFEH